MKIVINNDYGGFGLSHEGVLRYAELAGIDLTVVDRADSVIDYDYYLGPIENDDYLSIFDIERDDPALVKTVEELGPKSWGKFSSLKIVDIPDDVDWFINEYDGSEWVAEVHRTWR